MKNENTVSEVKSILKDLKGKRVHTAPEEKPILEWTAGELKAHVIKETKGMSIANKFKFAAALDKRIKDARKAKAHTS